MENFDLEFNDQISPSIEERHSNRIKKLTIYTKSNIHKIWQLYRLPEQLLQDMRVVAHIFPFKTNNYVLDELINWEQVPNDPIFRLNFPQKGMLLPKHFVKMKQTLEQDDKEKIVEVANKIRLELNPNPAGQKNHNVPLFNGKRLEGVQHKYRETVLFFPKKGQTCHAFCTFCFRWSQFVKLNSKYKFRAEITDDFIDYLQEHDTITDILVTGGDPMTMNARMLNKSLRPLIEADIPHLRTIRIGSKALSYWPYRFINDRDTDDLLALFSYITNKGLNLAFMAHFNHPQEMKTTALARAVKNIKATGAEIRTQSPLLNKINASADIWANMWKQQHDHGMIPYYFFVVRNTGAQHYFGVPLIKCWSIFREAYSQVSGLCRTVRGPSMSCLPGKIEILGPTKLNNQPVLSLRFIQGRNPHWVNRPFFAKYNDKALWLDELEPAFNSSFFFEDELTEFLGPYNAIKDKVGSEPFANNAYISHKKRR
jgi:KamA family protein